MKKYKEKVKALLNTITNKNEDIGKLKEDFKSIKEDLENKYSNFSSTYKDLSLYSGDNQLNKYISQNIKTNNDSNFSNEEDNIADILINTGKLSDYELHRRVVV